MSILFYFTFFSFTFARLHSDELTQRNKRWINDYKLSYLCSSLHVTKMNIRDEQHWLRLQVCYGFEMCDV